MKVTVILVEGDDVEIEGEKIAVSVSPDWLVIAKGGAAVEWTDVAWVPTKNVASVELSGEAKAAK